MTQDDFRVAAGEDYLFHCFSISSDPAAITHYWAGHLDRSLSSSTLVARYRVPMSSISRCRAKVSSVERGRAMNRLIRLSRAVKASLKARSISSAVPFTAAGSGIPQCAVMGWPGQNGHTSLAALSQTVKIKSRGGESAPENSSQDLLRSPCVGKCASSSCLSASGRTNPLGWLPALKAVKFWRPLRFMMASAMMDRAELPVQRKSRL